MEPQSDGNQSVSPIFAIVEQQTGANGWTISMDSPTPRPGQILLWTMQSIAHGADFIGFFRWRTGIMGTEIYWHGILDYSGRENRRFREVRKIAEDLEKMQEIAGAEYVAKAGIVRDYDNIWDAEVDRWHGKVEKASVNNLYAAAQLLHAPMDFVYLNDSTKVSDLQNMRYCSIPRLDSDRGADKASGGLCVCGRKAVYGMPYRLQGHYRKMRHGLFAGTCREAYRDRYSGIYACCAG